MKVLVIYAHPNTPGHCKTILKKVISELKSKKINYDLLDLYKIKYDPVLHKKELYTSGNKNISKQNLTIQKKIKKSDLMIFIYPIWWGSMPAILKGFFDKILTSGFAYEFIDGKPKGLLDDKQAVVFFTTGASKLASIFFNGSRPAKAIKNDILMFCGIQTMICQIGGATRFNKDRIELIKSKVKETLSFLPR